MRLTLRPCTSVPPCDLNDPGSQALIPDFEVSDLSCEALRPVCEAFRPVCEARPRENRRKHAWLRNPPFPRATDKIKNQPNRAGRQGSRLETQAPGRGQGETGRHFTVRWSPWSLSRCRRRECWAGERQFGALGDEMWQRIPRMTD
jgi:hypothetical protein